MADTTDIEWTDATWNIFTGCTMVDSGCTNCYAMTLAASRLKNHPSREGLTRESGGRHVWTGETRFNKQWLTQPLKWKRGRMIFVCAHGDLFHESVPDERIDKVFAVMALAPQHTFQVLTKRPDRAARYLAGDGLVCGADDRASEIGALAWDIDHSACFDNPNLTPFGDEEDAHTALVNRWPLPNVWLGTSISDQASADVRVPQLLAAPAAVRFLSAEPLLGPVNLLVTDKDGIDYQSLRGIACDPSDADGCDEYFRTAKIDWVICGGESGKNARPMHPDWARSLRDQCQAAGVAFFFKQWGEWSPCTWDSTEPDYGDGYAAYPMEGCCDPDAHEGGQPCRFWHDGQLVYWTDLPDSTVTIGARRVGKARAGRLLDGVEWSQMPEVQG